MLISPAHMSLKDHYRTLGVAQGASSAEIRDAFRTLAKKYHPDKAPENPHATSHFKEIREAYETLSHPARRAAYDEERWLRGMSQRSRHPRSLNPDWILQEARRLRRHMTTIDSYRMNHAALRDYVRSLLSPEHLSILQDAAEHRRLLLDEILASLRHMRFEFAEQLQPELLMLARNSPESDEKIRVWLQQRKSTSRETWVLPTVVLLFVLAFCLLMWWLR